MAKFFSNLVAFIVILVSLFLFSMSIIMLIVTDWNRWSEAVPLSGIAFAVLCAAVACWSLVLVPHFAAPFRIVPDFITRWLEENNKFSCAVTHTGYEPVVNMKMYSQEEWDALNEKLDIARHNAEFARKAAIKLQELVDAYEKYRREDFSRRRAEEEKNEKKTTQMVNEINGLVQKVVNLKEQVDIYHKLTKSLQKEISLQNKIISALERK